MAPWIVQRMTMTNNIVVSIYSEHRQFYHFFILNDLETILRTEESKPT